MLDKWIFRWFNSVYTKWRRPESLETSIRRPDPPCTVFVASLLRDEKRLVPVPIFGTGLLVIVQIDIGRDEIQ